jgi:AcrR family transcriptional regulator
MTQTKLGLRERKKLRTRETIIEAALALFAEQGFEDTTISEIADAAEIAPRTFFAYFPCKEDVVFADFPEMIEAVLTRLHDRPTEESVVEAMRSIHLAAIEHPAPDEERHKLQQQLIRDTEALAARNRDICGSFQEALANALHDDLGDELQARMVAAAMVAAFTGIDKVESGEDKMALVDQALDFVRGGISSRQAATGARP